MPTMFMNEGEEDPRHCLDFPPVFTEKDPKGCSIMKDFVGLVSLISCTYCEEYPPPLPPPLLLFYSFSPLHPYLPPLLPLSLPSPFLYPFPFLHFPLALVFSRIITSNFVIYNRRGLPGKFYFSHQGWVNFQIVRFNGRLVCNGSTLIYDEEYFFEVTKKK
jgi:hypothetical protein